MVVVIEFALFNLGPLHSERFSRISLHANSFGPSRRKHHISVDLGELRFFSIYFNYYYCYRSIPKAEQ